MMRLFMKNIEKAKLMYGNAVKEFNNGAYIISDTNGISIFLKNRIIKIDKVSIHEVEEDGNLILIHYIDGANHIKEVINVISGATMILDLRHSISLCSFGVIRVTRDKDKTAIEIFDNNFNNMYKIYNNKYGIAIVQNIRHIAKADGKVCGIVFEVLQYDGSGYAPGSITVNIESGEIISKGSGWVVA